MSWIVELCQAFSQLQAGGTARVSFATREDTVGELGREFNALAAALRETGSNGLSRERAHRLRNQLAGILAALHVLGEAGELTAEEQAGLRQLRREAQKLDACLRPQ